MKDTIALFTNYLHTGKTQTMKSRDNVKTNPLLKDLRAKRTEETTTATEEIKKKIIICLNIQKHLIRFSLFDSYKQFQVLLIVHCTFIVNIVRYISFWNDGGVR